MHNGTLTSGVSAANARAPPKAVNEMTAHAMLKATSLIDRIHAAMTTVTAQTTMTGPCVISTGPPASERSATHAAAHPYTCRADSPAESRRAEAQSTAKTTVGSKRDTVVRQS